MSDTAREKAHKALDKWLDNKLGSAEFAGRNNTPAMVYLGYEFAKALSDAKPNNVSPEGASKPL